MPRISLRKSGRALVLLLLLWTTPVRFVKSSDGLLPMASVLLLLIVVLAGLVVDTEKAVGLVKDANVVVSLGGRKDKAAR